MVWRSRSAAMSAKVFTYALSTKSGAKRSGPRAKGRVAAGAHRQHCAAPRQASERGPAGAVGHAHRPGRSVAEVLEPGARDILRIGEVFDAGTAFFEQAQERGRGGRTDDERQRVDAVVTPLRPQ